MNARLPLDEYPYNYNYNNLSITHDLATSTIRLCLLKAFGRYTIIATLEQQTTFNFTFTKAKYAVEIVDELPEL